MTYKIYLKTDYKTTDRWVPKRPWYKKLRIYVWALTGFFLSFAMVSLFSVSPEKQNENMVEIPIPSPSAHSPVAVISGIEYTSIKRDHIPVSIPPSSVETVIEDGKSSEWKTIYVAPGDSLSLIFDRMGLSPAVLYQVISAKSENKALKHLLPGQQLRFLINDGDLVTLEYDQDIITTLQISKTDTGFSSSIIKSELKRVVREAEATIDSSLFIAGQRAGLSDNLIMQLVSIYGWDIDFVLDIRKGDTFKLVYEEKFKDDVKVSEGPILAAEFFNNKRIIKTVRYEMPDGNNEYYSDSGASMRKAFIRTPLNFTRISSKFNLNRRHPVLNTIRAHKGVDYAAPTGTPVKAAGDGTITSFGRNGGYGRVIEIKHGGTYSTLYAHLSKYGRGLKKGSKVKQGQTIGYVGMSGLATGPHLHYEFRVNGAVRNPLTVSLPKADSIPESLQADFRQKSAPLISQLNRVGKEEPLMIALQEKDETEQNLIPDNY
jgi:murein DD-endopeptidase MepM/ murein hydrolase activator NlpD